MVLPTVGSLPTSVNVIMIITQRHRGTEVHLLYDSKFYQIDKLILTIIPSILKVLQTRIYVRQENNLLKTVDTIKKNQYITEITTNYFKKLAQEKLE